MPQKQGSPAFRRHVTLLMPIASVLTDGPRWLYRSLVLTCSDVSSGHRSQGPGGHVAQEDHANVF